MVSLFKVELITGFWLWVILDYSNPTTNHFEYIFIILSFKLIWLWIADYTNYVYKLL